MMIITCNCWNCDEEMKMALHGNESGDLFGGPETFNKTDETLAKKHGVTLKLIESRTAEESYLANTCPHCDAFIGKWFFFAHYLTPALYGDYEYEIV